MTITVARAERNGTEEQNLIGRTASVMTDVGVAARDATAVVAKHAPATLAVSRGTIERALATLRGSSSGSLALGAVFAAGVTGGLLLARAPRLLVALAFLLTLLLGGTLVGRGAIARLDEPSRGERT